MQKILFYRWGSLCEPVLARSLQNIGVDYAEFSWKMKDYHADSEFAMELIQILHKEQAEAVFSYDYFPLISMICEVNQIPYLSWIYDCPMLTLQSETIKNSVNYIFCFDRIYAERLKAAGAVHCIHYPLAGDASLLMTIETKEKKHPEWKKSYTCDISFVGNLYNEEKNRFRNAVFQEYTSGYLEGLIQAQQKVYGYNFVRKALTEEIVEEIVKECRLELGAMYRMDKEQMAADVVNMEVSAREREEMLAFLGRRFPIRLYTSSRIPDSLKKAKIELMGFADYEKEMPCIFHNSKINLNFTSRTIESGVPLRVFDILSCGGFCLTNYQEEIAQLFEDGQELVMFSDMRDMEEKAAWYLSHEAEREQIARNGYEKLKAEHDLPRALTRILHP